MTFVEGTEVEYQGNSGVIDFISQSYVVIAIPSKINAARLIVYRENYSEIHIIGK
jgi:hypothetical protein